MNLTHDIEIAEQIKKFFINICSESYIITNRFLLTIRNYITAYLPTLCFPPFAEATVGESGKEETEFELFGKGF